MNIRFFAFKERAMRSVAAYFRPTTVFVLLILILGAQSAMAQTPSGVTTSPVALSYGVPTGSTFVIAPSTAPASSPENVTVNITCSTAPCSSVTFSGATIGASNPALNTDNPSDFVINGAPSCSGTLTSPNTCQVSVYYNAGLAPATTLETALLTISSSAGNLTVPLSGAYGSIKLFDETNITSNSSPYTIASKQLNLSCLGVTGGPITPTGIISGTPDGKGNVLVNSYITLATGPALSPVNNNTPAGNLCSDGGDCFTFNYEDALFNEPGVVVNADPDTFANANAILPHDDPSNGAGGISPINVQSFLTGNPPGAPLYPEQALFTLLSDGEPADYGNSTLFLQTNCTAPGIIPGASVTLNPINTSNPATLTQTADLDNSPGQNISFTTSSAVANQQIQGLVSNGVVQVITDYPVPQQLFNQLVAGTSAAPSVCMRLTGEQDSNGNPMCKGFLLQCYTPGASGAAGVPSGDNCYNADALTEQAQRYLLFTSQFTSPDGPSGYNFLTDQPWVENQTTGYTLGQTVVDIAGYVQQVTTPGLSGSSYPFGGSSETVGAITDDGGVVWTNEGVNACRNILGVTGGPLICAQGTGPGLLMGGDNWLCPTDAPCTPPTTSVSATTPTSPATYNVASCAFDASGGLNGDLCPLDVMTSFQGAADAAPKGTSKISNSLFIPVVNQPLPSATANPGSGFIGQWTNTPASATISFTANPATYPDSATIPFANGFTSAPIYSVTGGLTTFGQPLPDTTYPVTGDYSVLNNGSGGAGASPTSPFCTSTPSAPTFSTSPSLVNLNNNGTPTDGIYNVHYFATDCALTEGLVYSPTPAQVTDATANWASFPFATIGVDTAAPTASCSQIPASPTPSGWYGSNVTVNCNVTDQNFNSNPESGPLTGSGFAPAVNGIQGSGSEMVTASTSVAVGSANASASTGTPIPSPCDQAGNCASGIPTGPFMIDLQSPTITTSGTPYSSTVGGSTITVSFTCNDGMGSGVQTCNVSATPANFVPNSPFCSPSSGEVVMCGGTIPTTTAESGTLTISATDNVGNTSQAMVPFTVNQEPLTITASNTAFTFGGTPPAPTALYTYGSVVQSATAPAGLTPPTCLTTATSTTPAGTDTGANTCSGAVSSNYSISYVSGNAVVGAEPLTITASNTAYTFGGTPPAPTPLYTYGSVVQSAAAPAGLTPPTCSTTATSTTPVGADTGANTCHGAGGGNYSISYVSGNAVVGAEPLTITASNTSFTDGSTPPAPTALYTYGTISLSSVPPAGLTPPTCTTTATSSTAPGSYPGANTCSGAVGSNYSISYVSGTATVSNPPVWTITPSSYYFGELSVGQTATSTPLAIYNPGTSGVAITVSIPENGYGEPGRGQPVGDPDDFHIISNNCPKTLAGGATCYVTVSYAADSDDLGKTGVYAYVTVTSGKTVLVKAEVSGKAVDPTVKMSSTNFNFGSQTTGSPVTEQVLTLTNTGPTTWLIHNLTLSGSATFVITSGSNECLRNGSLAAGASCQVYVTFKPARKGSTYTGSICVSGNEADGPLNLGLKGTGD
jgi:MBG domain (YGX type)